MATNLFPQGNGRSSVLLAVAKANNLDIELVETNPHQNIGTGADYALINRLGKIPSFVGADGFIVTECIAIAIYRKYRIAAIPTSRHNDEAYHNHSVIPV